jgi:hypothetical protein
MTTDAGAQDAGPVTALRVAFGCGPGFEACAAGTEGGAVPLDCQAG